MLYPIIENPLSPSHSTRQLLRSDMSLCNNIQFTAELREDADNENTYTLLLISFSNSNSMSMHTDSSNVKIQDDAIEFPYVDVHYKIDNNTPVNIRLSE